MPPPPKEKLALRLSLLACIVLVASCTDSIAPAASSLEKLEVFARSNAYELRIHDGVVSTIDGAYSYRRVSLSRPGKLSLRFAQLATGEVVALREAQARVLAHHRSQFGVLGMESALRLLKTDDRTPVTVSYSVNPDRLEPAEAKQRIEQTHGTEAVLHGPTNTVIVELAGASQKVIALAKSSWFNKVHVHEANPEPQAFGVPVHIQVPSAALTLNAHWTYNLKGVHGSGQKLGLMDADSEKCRILDEHESFSKNASIVYKDSNIIPCSVDSECGDCDAASVPGRCRSGRCVTVHATAAAGAMSSFQSCGDPSHDYCSDFNEEVGCVTNPNPNFRNEELAECNAVYEDSDGYMASQADLYIANDFSVSNLAGRILAYEWFLSEGVSIVTEPYALGSLSSSEPTSQDVQQDNYSRYDNMVFVRAAANGSHLTKCNGLNAICVGGFESQPVTDARTNAVNNKATDFGTPTNANAIAMRTPSQFDVWRDSSWKNPEAPSASNLERPYEVSRPNISALSRDVWLPSVGDATGPDPLWKWTEYSGNSFAAPAIAALLALYQEHCGVTFDSRFLRADLLASGYRGIGIDERYEPLMAKIATRTATQPLAADTPDVCKGPPFDAGPLRGRFLRFPTADSRFDCDYGQGVGPANAASMAWFCGGPPAGASGSGSSGGDTDGPGESIFGDLSVFFGPDPAGTVVQMQGTVTISPTSGTPIEDSDYHGALTEGDAVDFAANSVVPKNSDRLRTLSTTKIIEMPFSGSLPQGELVRAVAVYDSCPNAPTLWDNAVVNNIDIALCGKRADNGQPECIFVSESLDDNVEGFDVSTPTAYSEADFIILEPDPLMKCPNKDGSTPSIPSEKLGYKVITWP